MQCAKGRIDAEGPVTSSSGLSPPYDHLVSFLCTITSHSPHLNNVMLNLRCTKPCFRILARITWRFSAYAGTELGFCPSQRACMCRQKEYYPVVLLLDGRGPFLIFSRSSRASSYSSIHRWTTQWRATGSQVRRLARGAMVIGYFILLASCIVFMAGGLMAWLIRDIKLRRCWQRGSVPAALLMRVHPRKYWSRTPCMPAAQRAPGGSPPLLRTPRLFCDVPRIPKLRLPPRASSRGHHPG